MQIERRVGWGIAIGFALTFSIAIPATASFFIDSDRLGAYIVLPAFLFSTLLLFVFLVESQLRHRAAKRAARRRWASGEASLLWSGDEIPWDRYEAPTLQASGVQTLVSCLGAFGIALIAGLMASGMQSLERGLVFGAVTLAILWGVIGIYYFFERRSIRSMSQERPDVLIDRDGCRIGTQMTVWSRGSKNRFEKITLHSKPFPCLEIHYDLPQRNGGAARVVYRIPVPDHKREEAKRIAVASRSWSESA